MVARNRTVNKELAKQVIGSWVDVSLTGLGLATRCPPIRSGQVRSGPDFGKLLIRKRYYLCGDPKLLRFRLTNLERGGDNGVTAVLVKRVAAGGPGNVR